MSNNCIECKKSINNKVICPYCNYFLCKNCFQNKILKQCLVYYCPSCNKQFDFNFLYDNFTKEFITKDLYQCYINFLRSIIDYNILQHYTNLYNLCQNISKVYQILSDNNVKYEDYYFKLEFDYNTHKYKNLKETNKELYDKLHNLYQTVKDFITFNVFLKIFNKNISKSMIEIFLHFNFINDNQDDLINNFHFIMNKIEIEMNYKNYYATHKNISKYNQIQKLIESLDFEFKTNYNELFEFNSNYIQCPKCNRKINKTFDYNIICCSDCLTLFNSDNLEVLQTSDNILYFKWLLKNNFIDDAMLRNILSLEKHYNKQDFENYLLNVPKFYNKYYKTFKILKNNDPITYKKCLQVINKTNFNSKELFINFSKLLKLKHKPMNNGKFTEYIIKYTFKLIDDKQFNKLMNNQYCIKYYTDFYNNIYDNLIDNINNVFKLINIKENENICIKETNKVIKSCNDTFIKYYKTYSRFNIELIDNNYCFYKYNGKNYELKDESKDKINDENFDNKQELIQENKQDSKNYLLSAFSDIKLSFHEFLDLLKIYELCYLDYYKFRNYGEHSKMVDKLQLHFPHIDIIQNLDIIYSLLLDDDLKCENAQKQNAFSFRSTRFSYDNCLKTEYINKICMKNKNYTYNLVKYLYSFVNNNHIDKEKLTKHYNLIKNCVKPDLPYYKLLYTFKRKKQYFNKEDLSIYTNRARNLQKQLKNFNNNENFLMELEKINFDIETVRTGLIFHQNPDCYLYILMFEEKIMKFI